jgi:predicted kinase
LQGKNVVIDDCCINRGQRNAWVNAAHSVGIWNVYIVYLNVPSEVCKQRGAEKVDEYKNKLRAPAVDEGVVDIFTLLDNDKAAAQDIDTAVNDLLAKLSFLNPK